MLSARKSRVLRYIITAYLDSMLPVGSNEICDREGLKVSAATIRNDMGELEKLGFITHPHTSAGRIPTDKGYRYYVDNLLEDEDIPADVARRIQGVYKKKIKNLDDLIDKTSRIVSTLSQQTCIAAVFRPDFFVFKQVQLVQLDAGQILVIWITTAGIIRHAVIDMKEPVSLEYLQRIANFLNKELAGLPLEQVTAVISKCLKKQRDSLHKVVEWAGRIVSETLTDTEFEDQLVLEGRNYIFQKPDFNNLDVTRRIFELLDDKKQLLSIIETPFLGENISVSIGEESGCRELIDCSVITTGIKLRDKNIGAISIIGPKRISYGYGISLLQHISNIVNREIDRIDTI